jgi:hypothetical protein
MFDTGKNLPACSRVTRILHLDRHSHVSCIVQSDQQLFLRNPVEASRMVPINSSLSDSSQFLLKELREPGDSRSRGENIFREAAFARLGGRR